MISLVRVRVYKLMLVRDQVGSLVVVSSSELVSVLIICVVRVICKKTTQLIWFSFLTF